MKNSKFEIRNSNNWTRAKRARFGCRFRPTLNRGSRDAPASNFEFRISNFPIMHRKSIYFLVLAVAALIVLGIVMLFSTGAFAQDSHG